MQLITTAALFLPSLAVLASAQDSSDNSTQTLSQLIAELPPCALPCFESSTAEAGCETTDFACYCNQNNEEFIAAITPCIQNESDCGLSELLSVGTTADEFCRQLRENPSPSELAEASSVATSVLASAETAQPSQTDEPGSAARFGAMGMAGAAVVAAFAV